MAMGSLSILNLSISYPGVRVAAVGGGSKRMETLRAGRLPMFLTERSNKFRAAAVDSAATIT